LKKREFKGVIYFRKGRVTNISTWKTEKFIDMTI
jgi:hypothetical protein